jgi:hypothetical protein
MTDDVLRTARRAGLDPYFLAFALAHYAEEKRMDEPALTAALGATVDTLAHARLCRMPRTDPAGFQEDVARIAAKFGLNREVLAKAVRHGQVVAEHRSDPAAMTPEEITAFLAARDKTEP